MSELPASKTVNIDAELKELREIGRAGSDSQERQIEEIVGRIEYELRDRSSVETSAPLDLTAVGFHAYAMSESHLSGYRLIVGFDTLEQVQRAHEFVVQAGKRSSVEPEARTGAICPDGLGECDRNCNAICARALERDAVNGLALQTNKEIK